MRSVVRRESWGGIIGNIDGYGFYLINELGYSTIEKLIKNSDTELTSSERTFISNLEKKGFVDYESRSFPQLVDNGNKVSHMSAPIRVWIEVTNKCNLACEHCFNYNHPEFLTDIGTQEILKLLDELKRSGVLQITITGGEPLVNKDIYVILDHASSLGFGIRLFTNGTTLTENHAERLRKYSFSHIYASLDGVGTDNDALRGKYTFRKISRGIIRLSSYFDNVILSTTIHRQSMENVADLFDFAAENSIRSLLIRPLFQYKNESENPQFIPINDIPKLIRLLESESQRTGVEYQMNKLPFHNNDKQVFVYDSPNDVHFSHFSKHNIFGCAGGNTVVGVKSNGVIMACGFVAANYKTVGNSVVDNNFLYLWNNSENVTLLRDIIPNETCKCCAALDLCGGGCRANALQHNAFLNAIDPYCFWQYGDEKLLSKDAASRTPAAIPKDSPFVSDKAIITKCGSGSLY